MRRTGRRALETLLLAPFQKYPAIVDADEVVGEYRWPIIKAPRNISVKKITPNGTRLEALVLVVGENRLRAVIAGHNDTAELRRNYGQWSSDQGEVELEALIADHAIDISRLCTDFQENEPLERN